jgi:lipid A 3-O-deacylase
MSRLLFLALLGLSAAAHAQCDARQFKKIPKGQWYVHWENDLLTRFASDEYFTNGVRVGYAWEPGCEREWVAKPARWLENTGFGRWLGLGDPQQFTRSSMFGIGQSIYTPSNIQIDSYLPDDHPYAGYLYGVLRYDYTSPAGGEGDWFSQEQKSFELQTGVVGPSAQGAEVQKWVHEVMDDKDPKGWDHQLEDEPALGLGFHWQRRFARQSRTFDVTPSMSVAASNVQTYASAGLTMRVGQNITGFPSRPVEAARVSAGQLRDDHATCYGLRFISECYLFVGTEVRYIAHSVFLDGNTWREGGPSVDRVPLVLDITAGFRLRMPGTGITFSYIGVKRSKEFEPVPATSRHPDGRHEYGVASISWDTHF